MSKLITPANRMRERPPRVHILRPCIPGAGAIPDENTLWQSTALELQGNPVLTCQQ